MSLLSESQEFVTAFNFFLSYKKSIKKHLRGHKRFLVGRNLQTNPKIDWNTKTQQQNKLREIQQRISLSLLLRPSMQAKRKSETKRGEREKNSLMAKFNFFLFRLLVHIKDTKSIAINSFNLFVFPTSSKCIKLWTYCLPSSLSHLRE